MANGNSALIGPSSYDDHDGIRRYLDAIEESDRTTRDIMKREVLWHILLYLGSHWSTWDRLLGTYRPLALDPKIPRPVTNKFAVGANALVASLVGFDPPLSFTPATEHDDDIASANVADQILQVIKAEVGHRSLELLEAIWLTLTGDVFRVTDYGPDLLGPMTFVQHEQCQSCGTVSDPKTLLEADATCPQCKMQGPYTPAVDALGEPIGNTIPRGRLRCEIHTRLTLSAQANVDFLHDSPYVLIDQRRPLDWVARVYGPQVAEAVETETSADPSDWILRAIAHSTGYGGLMTESGEQPSPSVRVRRLWLRPSPQLPGGLYAEILGTQRVEQSIPWPYHDHEGRPILNITHTRFDQVPGRLWGKTRASDVAPKQIQRNKLESTMILFERRSSNDVTWLPTGSNVRKMSGQPGLMVEYNAMAGVPAPRREAGNPPPPYFIQRIEQIDQEMDTLWGNYEIMRGEAPKGVASYAGMQLLDDRARAGQSGILTNYGIGKQDWAKLSLNIWREYAEDERSLSLGEGRWAVQKFTKANLQGGVDVSVDLGMNRPYTQIGRRAVVEQAVRLALVVPAAPAERFRALQILGVPELMADYKRERMDASRENDKLLNGIPLNPPMPWENHPVHLETHKPMLTGERFEALLPEMQQAAIAHANAHFMQMQAQAAPSGPGQMAPGPPGPNDGRGGTAKGDGPIGEAEDMEMGPDRNMVMQDAQMASPDMG